MLSINHIQAKLHGKQIIDNITLPSIAPGSIVTLVGTNGAGKTTCLNAIQQASLKSTTQVNIDNHPIAHTDIGYLTQHYTISAHVTVLEMLMMTINAHSSAFSPAQNDLDRALTLLESLNCLSLANQYCCHLSGGQSQLVGLAQALITHPKLLILDEPTSALDIHNQLTLLNFIRDYTHQHGIYTLMILHDLNLILRYSDYVAAIHQGTLYQYGPPQEVLTSALMATLFNVNVTLTQIHDQAIMIFNQPITH